MLQRRRTDIKANNATIRRQMNPYNNLRSGSHARGDGFRQRNKNKIQLVILLLALFLFALYNRHGDGGTINDTENKKTNIRVHQGNAAPQTMAVPQNIILETDSKIVDQVHLNINDFKK